MIPAVVGVGAVTQRLGPGEGADAVGLMVEAARRAVADAGMVPAVDAVLVPQGSWRHPNPGAAVAAAAGAPGARTVLADLGVLQHSLLAMACEQVATGAARAVLVVGGEARWRDQQAQRAGVGLPAVAAASWPPGDVLRPAGALLHPHEVTARLVDAVVHYALVEDARRRVDGRAAEDTDAEVAALWAGFSEVAAGNPSAWDRTARSAEDLLAAGDRMLATPYRRFHSTQWNVDQAAAVLVAPSREPGAIFPVLAVESNHMVPVIARPELHRCPALGVMADMLADGGCAPPHHDLVDLYSCFPSAVTVQAAELGLGLDRPLTLTGGMAFAGGPFNNYVIQATVRMVERLRAGDGRTALVTCLSGMLTKQGAMSWSVVPPVRPFRRVDVTAATAAATQALPVADGPPRAAASVVATTTRWDRNGPVDQVTVSEHASVRHLSVTPV